MVTNEWNGDRKKRDMLGSMVKTIVIAGNLVESDQKKLSRVDTGDMRNSIDKQISSNGLTVDIGTNIEYAFANEFGTSKMTGSPFIRPSLLNNKKNILDIAIREGRNAIE